MQDDFEADVEYDRREESYDDAVCDYCGDCLGRHEYCVVGGPEGLLLCPPCWEEKESEDDADDVHEVR